jgi:sentrin-specific protease 1
MRILAKIVKIIFFTGDLNLICDSLPNNKYATIDSLLINKILSSDLRGISKCFDKYNQVDFQILFFPLFLNKNHWALLSFDTLKRKISVYDSIYPINRNLVTKISSTLAKYIDQLKGANCWNLEINNDYPKQSGNDNDCGVFVCLYAKHVAYNYPFNFSQADIPIKRNEIANEIRNFEIKNNNTINN